MKSLSSCDFFLYFWTSFKMINPILYPVTVIRNTILNLGEWSTRGCSKSMRLSSNLSTVCECTHLTHFAILLSASPIIPENRHVQLSLDIIGYVGVSLSVVAMAVTVFIFIAFKYVNLNKTIVFSK